MTRHVLLLRDAAAMLRDGLPFRNPSGTLVAYTDAWGVYGVYSYQRPIAQRLIDGTWHFVSEDYPYYIPHIRWVKEALSD